MEQVFESSQSSGHIPGRLRTRSLIGFAAFALMIGGLCANALAQMAPDPKLPAIVHIKALTVPYFAPEFIAKDKGFYDKYNLDVEFVTQVAQGAAGIPAIVADQVQTGQGLGAGPILQARGSGAKVTVVVSGITSTFGDFRLYAAADSGIKTAKDLVGKTVGITNAGSYADVMVMSYVSNGGVDLSQVKRLPVPIPSMCQALLSHQVDAAAIYSLFWIACEKQNPGKLTMLAKDSDAIPAAAKLYSSYVFADDYIKAHPDVVRAYVAAMKDAMRWIEANPEEAKKLVSARMKIAPDQLLVPTFAKDGCVDMGAAADWIKIMEKYKLIPEGSIHSPSEWTTNRFNPSCPQ